MLKKILLGMLMCIILGVGAVFTFIMMPEKEQVDPLT